MSILECHSRGDKRYSALYAKLHCGQTIEYIYQHMKRDKDKQLYISPKGKKPIYLYLDGTFQEVANDLHAWAYLLLWHVYFKEQPALLHYASHFTHFRDIFDRQGGYLFTSEMSYPLFDRCAQSAAIAYLVRENNVFPEKFAILQKSLERYWKKYPLS